MMVWLSEADRVRLDRLLKAEGSDAPGQRQRGYTSILSQALVTLESQFTHPPTGTRYGLVHALWLGLCQKVDAGSITHNRAIRIFEEERTQMIRSEKRKLDQPANPFG